jgi:hypothetical protein
MAAVAIIVVDAPARGLLRTQAEFGVTLAALDVAAGRSREQGESEQNRYRNADCKFQNMNPFAEVQY